MPTGVYNHWRIRTHRTCSIEGCNRKHQGKGLCKYHWNKQHYQDNKKNLQKYHHERYLNNKEQYRENAKKSNKTRMEKYRSDKKENLKISIRHSRWINKKIMEDKIWHKKQLIKTKKRGQKTQSLSLKNLPLMRYARWTEQEIYYLRKNYEKKTYLEMAMELERTFYAVNMAVNRFCFERKNRILKGRHKQTT